MELERSRGLFLEHLAVPDTWGAGVGRQRSPMALKEALVVPVISLSRSPWPLQGPSALQRCSGRLITPVEEAGVLPLPLF